MIERIMGRGRLSIDDEILYQAAIQVRGGVPIEQVCHWYASVDRESLETLLVELQEYDECFRGKDAD